LLHLLDFFSLYFIPSTESSVQYQLDKMVQLNKVTKSFIWTSGEKQEYIAVRKLGSLTFVFSYDFPRSYYAQNDHPVEIIVK